MCRDPDFRAVKQGEGPLVRRSEDEWIAAERRHEAIVSDEDFERVQIEMRARSTGNSGNRRRRAQKHFYPLRDIVHCATGHNPLRMHGKSRKGNNYYACGYRISYGDTAAEANGHGKWQYRRRLLRVRGRLARPALAGSHRGLRPARGIAAAARGADRAPALRRGAGGDPRLRRGGDRVGRRRQRRLGPRHRLPAPNSWRSATGNASGRPPR